MATLMRNPSLLGPVHSNSANSSSTFTINFRNSCSNLPIPHRQALLKSPRELGFQIRRSRNLIHRELLMVKASSEGGEDSTASGGRTFLSFEEAGLVEMSGLSTHERFLCRLTISSLNLLRVIAEQEGCKIEELNAGRVCDWFLRDKLKREQDIGSAVLQWEDDTDNLQF